MSMEKLQNSITDVKNIVKEDLHLLHKRQCDLEELSKAADTLHQAGEQFYRLAKDNTWRTWYKNNFTSIIVVFILVGIIVLFVLVIGFVKVTF